MRSKPAPLRPDLDRLIAENNRVVAAMTPEQRREMMRAQRRSWARGEVGIGSDADEAAYSRALKDGDQETLDRLQAEGDARVKER